MSDEGCFTFIIHHFVYYIDIGYIVSEILLTKKPEVIDTYYPWYRGTVVYKKEVYPAPYIPLYGSNTTCSG